jgi:hypothetical protein
MYEIKCPIFGGYVFHDFVDVCTEKDTMLFAVTIWYDEYVFRYVYIGGGC